MESIDKQVTAKIIKSGRGKISTIEDFAVIGSPEAVRQALHRLVKKAVLIRLSPGMYLYPKIDKELGPLYPSIDEIANTIARRDKARIIPTGTQSLNMLGLSTQVPMKIVYLTDGAPRSIKFGKRTIKFKKTTPRNLAAKSKICGLVIQALREIGKDKVSEVVIHDTHLAPAWIGKILGEMVNQL